MNKTAIKNFATWARKKLIADITYKASLMGITDQEIKAALPQSMLGEEAYDIGTKEPYVISGDAVRQRAHLARLIQDRAKGSDYQTAFNSVVEEVAYTWFNRLIAIRFMEVNDYMPDHIRVLSSENGSKLEPDMVTTPFDTELEFTEKEKQQIVQLKNDNAVDELFQLLFIKECNSLNKYLPRLFEKTSDYTELLLNVSVTDKEGVVYHLVHDIDEQDFDINNIGEDGRPTGQVEIIGWLYQYYNTEQNELVYDGNLSKTPVSKELLPAATTIYTPDWPIRYMVENSLGRLWLEGHPDNSLKNNWKYYLDGAVQEKETTDKLEEIGKEYSQISPDQLLCLDPCMGSGHILCYFFDVLMQIYTSVGYSERDAAQSILKNNIWGLDIDNRAFQLSYFAIMMKARQYDRRILTRGIQPHINVVIESNGFNRKQIKYFGASLEEKDRCNAIKQINNLLDQLYDAKEYGSIIKVNELDWASLYKFASDVNIPKQMSIDTIGIDDTQEILNELIGIGETLSKKYHIVCTNPPYLGSSRFSAKLDEYVKNNYSDEKSDLSMVMYNRALKGFATSFGFVAFITTSSWMFLSSFEKVRKKILTSSSITSLVDFGTELFEGKVGHNPIVSWVTRNARVNYKLTAIRLVKFCYSRRAEKEPEFFNVNNRYYVKQDGFSKIPGMPIAYWHSNQFIDNFSERLVKDTHFSGGRNKTHNNEKYTRLWWEISNTNRWQLYDKGGDFRRWYGNHEYVVDWSREAKEEYASHGGLYNQQFCGKEGICWTLITSSKTAFRIKVAQAHYDSGSPTIFNSAYKLDRQLLGFLNSNVATAYLQLLNPTINMGNTYVLSLPYIEPGENEKGKINEIVNENILLAKDEWNSYETSSEFQHSPWMKDGCNSLSNVFEIWKEECESKFDKLKANEEILNELFVHLYKLDGEISAVVKDTDICIRKASLNNNVKELLSYAVGCMFGRYSLDVDGLAYAGGDWDTSKYSTFIPDADNVIPITDEDYFDDDIVGLLIQWLKKVYGEDTLEENLDFIAKALGNKGYTSREIIRNYFLTDFFKDHCQTYSVTGSGKRPIYWLYDSGKQNGFKALIYMHRYNEDTTGVVRVKYLHRMEQIYASEIDRMQDMMDHSKSAHDVSVASKRKEKLQKQLKECRDYDEKIAHLALDRIAIDFDDGVKVNYRKVQTGSDGKFYEVLADSKNIMSKQ